MTGAAILAGCALTALRAYRTLEPPAAEAVPAMAGARP
jgi:hypothetical protein